MGNNGMRLEALELKRILNEKYELDINYTSSLRIIELLRKSKGDGSPSTPHLNEVGDNLKDIPLIELPKSNGGDLLRNILKLKESNNLKNKEKVLYFRIGVNQLRENFNSRELKQISDVGAPHDVFMKNFEAIIFESLEDFIKLSNEKIEELLSGVSKIFFTPTFYNIKEGELFIKLLHELSKEKYVAVLTDSSNYFMDAIVHNINYAYKTSYQNDVSRGVGGHSNSNKSDYFILDNNNQAIMKEYPKTLSLYDGRIEEKSKILNMKLMDNLSNSIDDISIGIDHDGGLVHWTPSTMPHLILKDNSKSDAGKILTAVEEHFKKFNKPVNFNHLNKVNNPVEKLLEFWGRTLKARKNDGVDWPLEFIILPMDNLVFESSEFKDILRMGRSIGVHVIIIDDDESNLHSISTELLPNFGGKILLPGNYSRSVLYRFVGNIPNQLDFNGSTGYYNFFGKTREFKPLEVK